MGRAALWLVLGMVLLAATVESVETFIEYSQAARTKKGLTYTATVYPE